MSQIKYVLISFLLFSYSIYSQSIQEILGIAPEFYIDISNSEVLTLYNFEISKIDNAYCFDVIDYPIEFITECIDCGINCDDCDGGLEEDGIMTDKNGNNLNGQNGFGFCAWGAKTRSPHYGYGVYKLLNTNNNKYIYIDTRDDKYTRTWI